MSSDLAQGEVGVRQAGGTLPFHVAVFLGAYLLFLVQPLIAKQILPWFGGAPAVWSTCLVFFQLALVLGYAYAHATRRLGTSRQVRLHIALLALALLTLPIAPSVAWKPVDADAPVSRVLALLTFSVGVPYVLLSATAPMLQDWYSWVVPTKSPYRLYVLSNAGSLIALLSYPALVERLLPTGAQALWWSIAFVGFVFACGWCAWRVFRLHAARDSPSAPPAELSPAPPAVDRFLWVALSACGSGLLLAATNQLCQDVAVVPLLWILPLAIYLLSFIFSFAGLYSRPAWGTVYLVAVAIVVDALANAMSTPIVLQAGALLLLLAAGCMVCHGELVSLRPGVGHLTAFYLAMSIGGSLGGMFVALAAPLIFLSYAEFPFLVLLVPMLLVATLFRDYAARQNVRPPTLLWGLPLALYCIASIIVLRTGGQSSRVLASGRNFYGILRVSEDDPATARALRGLYQGRVLHGAQLVAAPLRTRPTTYYAEGSGIDVAIRQHPRRAAAQPLKIGIVGLGAGTIAAWGASGDSMRFFELNPQVVDFAERYFTFMKDSPADVTVVTGDARLSLERELSAPESQHSYDVLVVDAFSGDSIPIHLLTRECFALYWQALSPDGVLALHVSNRHLDLGPVVRGLAGELQLEVLEVTRGPDPESAARTSMWMLVTGNASFIARAAGLAQRPPADATTLIWTDSFSSLFSVLR